MGSKTDRENVAVKLLDPNNKLADYSQDEQCAMAYKHLLTLRREAYVEAMDKIPIPEEIEQWARRLEWQHLNGYAYQEWCSKNKIGGDPVEKTTWAKTLGVHDQRLPLLTAFMVIRWGEEPSKWPAEFTADDIQRAVTWFDRPRANEGLTKALINGI